MALDISIPDPTPVLELLQAFRKSKTMFAAVELGIFDALSTQGRTIEQLASQLELNSDALERLLDALIGLGLLRRVGSEYSNTPAATTYLTSDSPRRMTGYIRYSNDVSWLLWQHLESAIRTGDNLWQQAFGWDGPIFANFFKTDAAKREFLMGMHGFGLISSPHVVEAFDLSEFRHLVDLGGATGHLVIAACRRYPHLRGTVFDLPDAVPLAREMIAQYELSDRITVVAGDFFSDALPAADLYCVGRILHDWSESKINVLLQKAFSHLPSGGAILVGEKMLAADKRGPDWAQMQNLNMLTCTEGKERTLAEYEQLLTRAGFVNVVGCCTQSPLDAILARKP
jgi:acetylserotonin N-methyltransferase